jgi:hypothetical protein
MVMIVERKNYFCCPFLFSLEGMIRKVVYQFFEYGKGVVLYKMSSWIDRNVEPEISKGIWLLCRLPIYLKQSGKAICHEIFLFLNDGCFMKDAVE